MESTTVAVSGESRDGGSRRPSRGRRAARRTAYRAAPAIAAAVFIGAWQLIGMNFDPLLIPSFSNVVTALVRGLAHGGFLDAMGVSAVDVLVGFAISLGSGLILGIAMGAIDIVDRAFAPFVNFMNATPTVVLVPVIIIWLGEGFTARVFFVWIISVWAVVINTLTGVRNADKRYLEVGRAFGFRTRDLIFRVRVPAAMPYVFAGVRLALGHAIIGMIIGEMDLQLSGIGGLATAYGNSYETADLLAVIFVASMFGVFGAWVLKCIQLFGFRWITEVAGAR